MTTIKWTDAACDALAKAYRASPYALGDGNGYGRPLAREMLNAATAEQFREETAEEKSERLETEMRKVQCLVRAGANPLDISRVLDRALAGPNGKEP